MPSKVVAALAPSFTPLNYQATVLAASPDVYYRMSATSGTTEQDTTVNNNDGTYAGTGFVLDAGAVLPSDAGDKSVDFPVSTTGVLTSDAAFANSNDFACEVVFELDTNMANGFWVLAGKWNSTSSSLQRWTVGSDIALGSQDLYFNWRLNGGALSTRVTSSGNLTTGKYHLILQVSPAPSQKIWLNGTLILDEALVFANSGTESIMVGNIEGSGATPFTERISEMAYYTSGSTFNDALVATHFAQTGIT